MDIIEKLYTKAVDSGCSEKDIKSLLEFLSEAKPFKYSTISRLIQ